MQFQHFAADKSPPDEAVSRQFAIERQAKVQSTKKDRIFFLLHVSIERTVTPVVSGSLCFHHQKKSMLSHFRTIDVFALRIGRQSESSWDKKPHNVWSRMQDVTNRDVRCAVCSNLSGHTGNVRSCSVNCRRCDEKAHNNHDDDEDKSATTASILKLQHWRLFLPNKSAEKSLCGNMDIMSICTSYCG